MRCNGEKTEKWEYEPRNGNADGNRDVGQGVRGIQIGEPKRARAAELISDNWVGCEAAAMFQQKKT
jgi:hypothetical protein